MSEIIIRLTGAPQGKARSRLVSGSGHASTPSAARSYAAALRIAAQDAMGSRRPLSGAVNVLVVAAFPIPKSFSREKRSDALIGEVRPTVKPDIDSLLKVIDALNGIVFEDDRQVVRAEVEKIYALMPELTIRVTERP